jgi:hypothetical protein
VFSDISQTHDYFGSIRKGKFRILVLIISAAVLLVDGKIRVSCYRSGHRAEVNSRDVQWPVTANTDCALSVLFFAFKCITRLRKTLSSKSEHGFRSISGRRYDRVTMVGHGGPRASDGRLPPAFDNTP